MSHRYSAIAGPVLTVAAIGAGFWLAAMLGQPFLMQ